MNKVLKTIFLGFLVCIFTNSLFADTDEVQDDYDGLAKINAERPIRVATKVSEPFIIKDTDSTFYGLSIFLWEGIAEEMELDYEYVEYSDLNELLRDVKNGKVDIAINPITVTQDRLVEMEFTQPFFITNLAIAVRIDNTSAILRLLKRAVSREFWMAISLLAFVILFFGFFLWLFERKYNEEEFDRGKKGLWDSFWWSAVTMTTVGYGDKVPKSVGGRVVGLVWMFAAVIIFSGFTASIASTLTVGQLSLDITDISDLRNARVVSIQGSNSQGYLSGKRIRSKQVSSVEVALKMIANDEADAFVYDEPLLRYKIEEENLIGEITVAPANFLTQYYAYALPLGMYRKDLNLAMLDGIESLEWKAKLAQYELE